jgi:uncharacterized protein YrrD
MPCNQSRHPIGFALLPTEHDGGVDAGHTAGVNDEEGGVMDIAIGADVLGTSGKLGTVHRVIVDARTNTVTDMVVKHGFAWGNERVVPRGCVTGVDSSGVHVNVDEHGFAGFNGYTDDRYRAPDPSYVGPPGFDNSQFMLDEITAAGPTGGIGQPPSAPPLGFPGGETISPDDMQRPVLQPGTPVLDSTGAKIGEVHEFAVNADSGAPDRLVLRKGFIFHTDTPLPVAWIDEISYKGVLLKVERAAVEQHATEAARADRG